MSVDSEISVVTSSILMIRRNILSEVLIEVGLHACFIGVSVHLGGSVFLLCFIKKNRLIGY